MKSFLMVTAIALAASQVSAEQAKVKGAVPELVNVGGDLYELVYESSNGGDAHFSANVFSDKVGDVLKARYPSKILDPDVQLRVYSIDGAVRFRMRWNCRIVKSSEAGAVLHFDRRGSMLSGAGIDEARAAVIADIENNRKPQEMSARYKDPSIPPSFVRDSRSGSTAEGYWYIREIFLVASRFAERK